jgi:hypothetical protein
MPAGGTDRRRSGAMTEGREGGRSAAAAPRTRVAIGLYGDLARLCLAVGALRHVGVRGERLGIIAARTMLSAATQPPAVPADDWQSVMDLIAGAGPVVTAGRPGALLASHAIAGLLGGRHAASPGRPASGLEDYILKGRAALAVTARSGGELKDAVAVLLNSSAFPVETRDLR